ncbi:MAG: DEAD/DEAH box helicase [Sneathiella sp.]|nr:DEAD/DEAH box helicase [Sneathiella sp.]
MTEFDGVTPSLVTALEKRGYSILTPVQKDMLAPELKDADALVSAQTGSGKTVAFGIAIAPTLLGDADRFTSSGAPTGLVIAPTRELALQVKSELEWLYAHTGATVASCVGGMDMRAERSVLNRGAHIVVGTPGRLTDHIRRGSFDTSKLKAIVLDEADEMLDMGFRDDLEYILDASPKERRTLMFSATVSKPIAGLAKRYQRDAIRITTAQNAKQHQDIEYRALTVASNDRENAIINLLRYFDAKNAIVFCGTRAAVNHLTARFNNRGFSVVALSGELSQTERSHALQAMRDGRARVCVATDVAARGIDLPNLELVIHADLPRGPEPLLHRSGRTGRAGRKGVSALIVPHNWRKRTERLLSNAKIKATWGKPPSIEDIAERDRERFLADPAFSEPVKEEELPFVKELQEKFSVDQIAAALIRLHQSAKPAAEELMDTGPDRPERPQRSREDFKESVWLSLSVGRKHTAEPKWLIPMLCRAGNITNNEIGAIRIQQEVTYVELQANCADQFMEAIAPSGKLEKTVDVTRLNTPPNLGNEGRGGERSGGGRRDERSDRGERGSRDGSRAKRKFEKRADRDGRDGDGERPKRTERSGSSDKAKDNFRKKIASGADAEKPREYNKKRNDDRSREGARKKEDRGHFSEKAQESFQKRFGDAPKDEAPRKTLSVKSGSDDADGKSYGKFDGKPKSKGKGTGGRFAKGGEVKTGDDKPGSYAPRRKKPSK